MLLYFYFMLIHVDSFICYDIFLLQNYITNKYKSIHYRVN